MTILLPELSNPEVNKFFKEDHGDLDLWFDDRGLAQSMEMLRDGKVDGLVVGASHTSAEVIREGLRTIGSKEKFVSSFFVMRRDEEELFFADCAVNPNPSAEKLAMIAEQTSVNAMRLGYKPVVAFLSFSTEGSADHEMVQKVRDARDIFEAENPDIEVYGDIQFDAAADPDVYEKKTGVPMGSLPNVFIFPDLNSGNIAYKITQRLAGYTAIGPILQGFNRPLFDLSRGVDAAALREVCIIANKLIEKTKGESNG